MLVIGPLAANATYSGVGTFTKITSLVDLTDGYYVLVNSGDAFAMNNSATQVANCLGYTEVVPVSNSIINPATSIVWKIETNSGYRTIYNEASAKYVSYTGSSNDIQVVDEVATNNQRWTFSYASNVFTIANVALDTRMLQYYSAYPRFACYTSSQQKILLYKLVIDESCTASNLSFANATINKTMGDAKFTIAASSLNATTAITYESDNTNAATVNDNTGEVTIVGVGAAKIKATQAAGSHESVDYCAANVEYTLNVATNLPTITVTEVLPTFSANVGASNQKTLAVTSANLTADIALTITGDNAAMFAVTSTLPAEGGTATITYSPTEPGTHTATLALKSAGATEVLIALNGTGLTLSGNGTKTNPYSVADVKSLNNSLGTANKYWVDGYIVGTPSGGNGVNLTTVALEAPFSNSAIAIADMADETDLTKMIGVQLPIGAVRVALNLADNSGNFNRKVKVFGTFESYFAATGVKNTTDYEFYITSVVPSATIQSLRKVGNQIVFETIAQQSVEIFNTTGQRLMSTTTVDGVNAITVNAKGMVLVKIGKETAKVIM